MDRVLWAMCVASLVRVLCIEMFVSVVCGGCAMCNVLSKLQLKKKRKGWRSGEEKINKEQGIFVFC